MLNNFKNPNERMIGIWYAIAAYLLWGILPLYWKFLQEVQAAEILAHRIIWSLVFVSIILLLNGRWNKIREVLANRSNRIGIILSGLLISVNWFIYIWAVNSNQIVEASLGYYINPLFSVLLGMLFLKERLNFWQSISLILAVIGVAIITLSYGSIPWIALSLTFTFGLYGLSKKLVKVDSVVGLALETILVSPIALAYLIIIGMNGTGSFGVGSISLTLLLIGSGIPTATPLLWFAQAAKRIPLSTVGFIQYLAPTISLLLGVIIFKEPFTTVHLISFSFIWAALALYSFSGTEYMQKFQPSFFNKNNTENI